MKKEDWKRMIEAWQASRKHQELKRKLKSRRMYTLNTEEIQKIIEGIFEFNELTDEEKESFDWLDIETKDTITKGDLIQSLIEVLIKWNFYLYKYELSEEFELCCKLRDVIEIEVDECRRMVRTYFFIEDDDEKTYEQLKMHSRESVHQHYFDWLEYLKQDEI